MRKQIFKKLFILLLSIPAGLNLLTNRVMVQLGLGRDVYEPKFPDLYVINHLYS